jgi:hypothetical protein
MGRSKAVKILNLPKPIREQFIRALALSGAGSQSSWIYAQIRRFIRQQQEQFGEDLFQVLTAEERDLINVIESGAAEIQHIAQESLLPLYQVERLLNDLIARGIVETQKKGGKTDGARGARIDLYFVSKKYKSNQD